MTKFSWKTSQIILCALTVIILSLSFFLEYLLNLAPCPLCIMQRAAAFLLGACFISALIYNKPAPILIALQLFFAICGLYFALRQLWLMSLPLSEAPACMPGLTVLVHYFPLKDILHTLFWGTGDCTENPWRFLGLSMPAWSALYFCCTIIGIIISILYARMSEKHS